MPATLPVEFTERLVYLLGELRAMRPQLGAVVMFDGRLDDAHLVRALRSLLATEPVLGCRFMADEVPPIWRRLDHVDDSNLLRASISDDPAADAAAFVAEPLDPREGPQLLGALFRGAGGDSLAIKMAHVAVDGGALKETLYLLADAYRSSGRDAPWTRQPNVDGVRAPFAKAGVLEWCRSATGNSIVAPPTDWGWTDPVGDRPARYLAASLDAGDFRTAIESGKRAGATVNDLILTAYYRVLCRLFDAAPGDRTPLQVSCELRKHLPPGTKTALSNISSAWSISLTPVADETFDATLARVVERTNAWKIAGAGRSGAVMMPMMTRLTRKQGLDPLRKQMVKGFSGTASDGYPTLTNIGIIDQALLDFGASPAVTDAWLLGPIGSVVVLTASTYRDRLHLTLGAETEAIERRSLASVATDTATEIADWVRSRQ